MARTIITTERVSDFAPADLCRLVGDVRAYPQFIPWLKSLKVTTHESRPGDGWEGDAEATVGWKSFTERFTSHVRCEPEKGEVDVTLVKGPLHSLENRWRFAAREGGGAHVRFWIAYEFKNPLLHAAASVNRERIATRIMEAFEAEAQRRLG